jgi:hypothetical protein
MGSAPPVIAAGESAAGESAAGESAPAGGVDDIASSSSGGFSSSYTTGAESPTGTGFSDAGASAVFAEPAGASLAAGTSTPVQAIGSVRPIGLRTSVKWLLVAVWAASMVALVVAAAWQRGAANA